MVTVLIVISWHGHHPSYCAELVRACGDFSRKVYVLCPGEANPLERLAGEPVALAKLAVVNHTNRAARTGFKNFTDLRADFAEMRDKIEIIRRENASEEVFIFHTSLDSLFIGVWQLPLLWFSIRKFLPWPFAGLMLNPERRWPLTSVQARVDRWCGGAGILHRMMSRTVAGAGRALRGYFLWWRNQVLKRSRCGQIALQDERYGDWLKRTTGKDWVLFPETTLTEASSPPPELASTIGRARNGRTVVGLLGAISRRKGTDLLVETIRLAGAEEFLFVIAGPCAPGEIPAAQREFLAGRGGNVIFSPEVIASEKDFNTLVAACDILYCAYKGHLNSSNVISKGAEFRKPLLVSEGELMAKRVRDHGLGEVLAAATPEACLALLRQMSAPGYADKFLREGRFVGYMEKHSSAALEAAMRTLSRSAAR